MCGWNGSEKVSVQSVEVKVDAALIEELRAGYAQLVTGGAKHALLLEGATPVANRGRHDRSARDCGIEWSTLLAPRIRRRLPTSWRRATNAVTWPEVAVPS
jgi:hypothetical protein